MAHLIDIKNLTKNEVLKILDHSASFMKHNSSQGLVYKPSETLKNKIIFTLFYEPSTRTSTSFETAAYHLGAKVVNINVANSSVKKGESLRDTTATITAMQPDCIIVRHQEEGTAQFMADICSDKTAVINAGDGKNAHPTQALLDLYTIRQFKGDITQQKIVIIGDILHSRVAKSLICGLQILGCNNINLIAPHILLPNDPTYLGKGVQIFDKLEPGIKDADVVVCLRLQKERMQHSMILDDNDFFNKYGVTFDILKHAKPDVIVMHPGPINRNVEISSEVADSKHSVILNQVTNGVAVRMAVLDLLLR
ncbi:MAG: aspartate carbamoyltransferase catalytic subunit [Gammaproteobacteria bacterium]